MCQFSITSTNSLDLLFWALFYNARLLCFCIPLWISTHKLILSAWTSLSTKTRGVGGGFQGQISIPVMTQVLKCATIPECGSNWKMRLYLILQKSSYFFSCQQSVWTFRWICKKAHYLLNTCCAEADTINQTNRSLYIHVGVSHEVLWICISFVKKHSVNMNNNVLLFFLCENVSFVATLVTTTFRFLPIISI